MFIFNYQEYNYKYLGKDLFMNLIIEKNKKNFEGFLKLQFIWVDRNINKIRVHYNFFFFYLIFGKNFFFKKLKQGRLNKNQFFILEVVLYLRSLNFFNFFFFDFLRFFFFLENKIFGRKMYTFKLYKNFLFFRLYNFDIFFNKRLSDKIPFFFPNISLPINVVLKNDKINLLENKLWKNLKS